MEITEDIAKVKVGKPSRAEVDSDVKWELGKILWALENTNEVSSPCRVYRLQLGILREYYTGLNRLGFTVSAEGYRIIVNFVSDGYKALFMSVGSNESPSFGGFASSDDACSIVIQYYVNSATGEGLDGIISDNRQILSRRLFVRVINQHIRELVMRGELGKESNNCRVGNKVVGSICG